MFLNKILTQLNVFVTYQAEQLAFLIPTYEATEAGDQRRTG